MNYFNEATAEMISAAEPRDGVIPVKKTISPRDTCQDGFSSSEKLTILNDELEFEQVVKLNYIGDKEYLESENYPVNSKMTKAPCLDIPSLSGLKITDCDVFPDAEETAIFEVNEDIYVERRELYSAYATSFILADNNDYEIIDSSGTAKVHISNFKLKMDDDILCEISAGKRNVVTVFKVRGIWKDGYYRARTTMFTIVVLGDTIVGVKVNVDKSDTDFSISTYSKGLLTYSSIFYNFHPSETMPGTLSHDGPRMWNPWWSNNLDTYNQVYSKMGPVLNKVCAIIMDLKEECR
jgi:hypothetical protein